MSDTPPPGDKFHQDTNEVQDFLTKIKLGWLRYGNWISGAMLVAAIAWFGWNMWQRHKQEAGEKDGNAFLSDNPAVLVSEAGQEHDPKAAALLVLHGADLFLQKSHTETKDEEAKKALASAEAAYKQVIAHPAADALLKRNAQLGLAQVAESKGDWAGAEAAYDALIKDSGAPANLVALAEARKAMIPSLKAQVVYGPEPVKVEDVAPVPHVEEPKLNPLPTDVPNLTVPAPAAPAAPATETPKAPEAPAK